MKLTLALLATLTISSAVLAADPSQRFQDAQQLLRDGEVASALAEFSELREQHPQDVDYALAKAQVLVRLGRDEEALLELDEATQLAPGYEEVSLLRSRILARQANDSAIWAVTVGAGRDDLSNGLPSWNEQFLELTRQEIKRNLYGVRLARSERYNEADYSLGLYAQRTLPQGWFYGGGVTLADDSTFRPDLGFNTHVGLPFAGQWVANLAYRRSEYTDTTVSSIITSVERYVADFRFAYAVTQSRLHGASSFASHTLTSNWYYRDNASIGITISTGKEAESLGNGQVLESDVSGLSLSGRYRFNDRYSLQWWLGTHEQGNFYRRQSVGMAVSIKL